ncbi:DUF1294 domain-containing protein [Pseudoalteromonas sp. SW0106-04]|uniref:DUF1294 domain-containing protein n=1 Tax=Pseudoalteromonas sp. SW0106-04 TaxID=1702169 RepID=UPI0009E9423E|nr:DUF1294 domain-containing protein [Pseudoalteromonas sp. SW0106-04]
MKFILQLCKGVYSLLFVCAVALLCWQVQNLWPSVFYLCMSTITFMWFWHDKRAAQRQHSRTPERDLLIWSLFGGWLGALAAQTWLRHKSQKRAFIIKLWVTILVHCWMFIIVAVQLVLGSDALW